MAYKSFKYRLYPTQTQERRLFRTLAVCRHWYNMCLEDRKLAWEHEQRSVTKLDQYTKIKHYRQAIIPARNVPVTVLRQAAQDVDFAYQHFFRRVKNGEKPGYPKFKSRRFFNSFGFTQYGSFKPDKRAVYIQGVGRVAVRWHRPLEGQIKTARVNYEGGQWYMSFACEIPDSEPLPQTGRHIGLDMGIHHMLMDSNGKPYENPQPYRAAQAKLRVLLRKLDRQRRANNPNAYHEDGTAKKGYRNWTASRKQKQTEKQISRLHRHIKEQRRWYINQIVHDLTRDYDLIAVEDLRIKNMVRNKHLSKSILDSGWGYFVTRLEQKASETGAQVVKVDPAYTSKSCSNCGSIFEDLTLSQRWVRCDCGLSLDRDHNAALNVLYRAVQALPGVT